MMNKFIKAMNWELIFSDKIKIFLNILARFFIPSMSLTIFVFVLDGSTNSFFLNTLILLYSALIPFSFLLYDSFFFEWGTATLTSCSIILSTLTIISFSSLTKATKLKLSLRLGIINCFILLLIFKLYL